MVIIWDYRNRKMKSSYEMHKVRVEDVCFTENGQYLISLGGTDDGRIIIWDIENGTPLCGRYLPLTLSLSFSTYVYMYFNASKIKQQRNR